MTLYTPPNAFLSFSHLLSYGMATRFVLVDDMDPGIHYDGAWVADKGSRDRIGNFGAPYQSTLHSIRQSGSLSFPFSGTQVWVVGSNNIRNDSNVIDPQWECFLDGVSVGANPYFRYPLNNWFMCEQSTPFKDGPHVLTLNITIAKGTAFWFDYILYAPSPKVPLYDKKVFIEPMDPEIDAAMRGTGGWQRFGNHANITSVSGTKLKFNFTGSVLEWYGGYPADSPHESSTATYSIDGQQPVNFTLRGLTGDKPATQYHQKLFETSRYPYGNHEIQVVYEGSKTPLMFDYVVVHSNETKASLGKANSKVPAGALVGAVVGVLIAFLFVAIAIFLFIRSRRGHKFQPLSLFDFSEPSKPPSPEASRDGELPVGSISPYVDFPPLLPPRTGDHSHDTSMYTQSTSSLGLTPVRNPENLLSPGGTAVLPVHSGPPPVGKQALGMMSDYSLGASLHSRSGSSSEDPSKYGYNSALAPVRNPENLFPSGGTVVLPVHSGPPPLGKQALGMMSDHSLGASTHSRSGAGDSSKHRYNPGLVPVRNPGNLFSPGGTVVLPVHSGPPPIGKQALGMTSDHSLGVSSRSGSRGDSSKYRYNPALVPVRNPDNLFSPGGTLVLPVHSGPPPFGKQALGMMSDHSLGASTHSRSGSSLRGSSRHRYDPVGNPDNIFSSTEDGTVLLPVNSGPPPPGKRSLNLTADPRRRPRSPTVSMYSDTGSSLGNSSRYPPSSRSRHAMPGGRTTPARVVVHTDSGLRLGDMDRLDDRTSIISEIPPQYSTR